MPRSFLSDVALELQTMANAGNFVVSGFLTKVRADLEGDDRRRPWMGNLIKHAVDSVRVGYEEWQVAREDAFTPERRPRNRGGRPRRG